MCDIAPEPRLAVPSLSSGYTKRTLGMARPCARAPISLIAAVSTCTERSTQTGRHILFRFERRDLKPEPAHLGHNCNRFVSGTPDAIRLNFLRHFAIYSTSSPLAVSQSAVSLVNFRNRLGALTHIADLSIPAVAILSLAMVSFPSYIP